MASNWVRCTLGEVLELKRGYDLPQQRRTLGRVPVVSSSGVTDHHSEATVRGPGVVTGRYGTLGEVFFLKDDFWPLNTTLYVRDFKGNDPLFVSYFLRSLDFSAYSDKAAVPGLNRNHLHGAPVLFPEDPVEQRRIAHVLGTLDDRIELNRRAGETLEGMARALFKSWFVDFDPVRAKAAGRHPGLPKRIVDLFPSRLVESELGGIPEGWEVGDSLGQARLSSGGTPKTDEATYWNGPVLWASAKDVSQCDETFLVSTERSITEKGLNESATRIIPALSTMVVARGATTGRMTLCGCDMAMNQTCYALTTTIGTPFALYCGLREGLDTLVHSAHGSVFDTITTQTFLTFRVVIAPVPLLREFETHAAALMKRVLAAALESRTLAGLRDALLPKLLSGELRLRN